MPISKIIDKMRGLASKDEDVVSDEYIVEYDVSEIGNVLSNIRDIENAMDNFEKQFNFIKDCVKNTRKTLHKLIKDEDLP